VLANSRRNAVLRSLLLFVSVFAALEAGAATFAVNSTSDQSDAVPGNGTCSVMAGICTLRAAIQEANAFAGADVIQIPAGIFTLSIAGAGDENAATGDLDIRDDVTIEGAGAGTTIVDGGALDRVLHVQPMNVATLAVTVRDVTLRNGATTDIAGAGILHADEGSLLIEDATVSGDLVSGSTVNAIGGGIAATGLGSLTIRRSLLTGNGAYRGAAIFHNGPLQLADSTVSANTAAGSAALDSYGFLLVERCAFHGNTGVVLFVDGGTISNSTVSGNDSNFNATILAGTSGIWIESSTIAGNTASYALYTSGPATLVNDVFAGSSAGPECGSYGGGSILSLGHNLDDDGTCAGSGPGDLPGQNPQLGVLANNGGPTLTRMPAPLSPLANAGAGSNCPPDDQRGVLRNLGPGNACDIGAVEFSVPEPAAAALGLATLLSLGMLRRRHD
jgi:CSLREA domain-containing protein